MISNSEGIQFTRPISDFNLLEFIGLRVYFLEKKLIELV